MPIWMVPKVRQMHEEKTITILALAGISFI